MRCAENGPKVTRRRFAASSSQLDQLACRSSLPLSRPRKASGAAAIPCATLSRYLSLPVRDQRAELLQRFGPDVHVLADDEAFDRQARLQDELRLLQRDRLAVVAADHSAQRDPAERVHARQHRVEHGAADVLEVAVDAVRRRLLQRLVERLRIARAPCSRCRRRSRARRSRSGTCRRRRRCRPRGSRASWRAGRRRCRPRRSRR